MVSAVVPPVVGGLLGAVASNVAAAVIKLIGNGYNYWWNFDNDIECLKRELLLISGAGKEQLSGNHDLGIEMKLSMEEMRDLASEIEDFLDRIQRHVVEKGDGPLYAVLGFPSEVLLEGKVKKLKERLKNAYERKPDHKDEVANGSQPSASSASLLANTYWMSTNITPVGIDESKKEICDWVMKDARTKGQSEKLSVISILGFSGSGKSTLAKAVYDSDDVKEQFPHKVRIVASKHGGNTKGLLTELLEKLGQRHQISDSEDIEQLRDKISTYLKKNTHERYLIVLDDIKDQRWWLDIEPAFPEKATVRIIVTTTIQRVAIACRRGDGYVHNIAGLEVHHCNKLMNDILKSTQLDGDLDSIVKKCDGNPYAVVAAANYLQGNVEISKTVCEDLSHKLGHLIETDNVLENLRNVLMNSYNNLQCITDPNLNLKTCLLYLCVFPNDCHIRCSRLMRRCWAERYVQNDSALEVPDELRNQSVIWSIDSRKNGRVKTCRAHGFFHDFLLHMSMSAKFITSLENKERGNYRHLFLQNRSRGLAAGGEEQLRAHSLTICGNAGEAVGYFDKCHLLRVLDLEDCHDLEDKDLDCIHKLWHLKYLSVGNTISRLPKDIEKLYCLETLDMRTAKKEIIILPVEVLKMPHLAHLFGKFKLKNNSDENKRQQYVLATSNLQTLEGFVKDDNPMFQLLMDQMKQLRKVKIWATTWRNSSDEDPDLERSINKFVVADLGTGVAVRSLSLDIGNFSGKILRSLACGFLRSLKLYGDMSALVDFFALKLELYSVKELCLSFTNNNNLPGIDLSGLREFKYLEYLKLIGISLEGFVIESEDFKGLLRLCLVQCPSLPTIRKGALPKLLSLRLLNQDLVGLSDIDIEHHEFLQEVALDSGVNPTTREDWEKAAKKHPRRPKILFFKRVDPDEKGSMVKRVDLDEMRSMVKYFAIERPPPEMESPIVGKKGNIDAVRSGTCVETNSGLNGGLGHFNQAAKTAWNDDIPSSSSAYPNCGDCILSNGKLRVSRSF